MRARPDASGRVPMRPLGATLAQAAVAAALAGALYAIGLAVSPPHLTHDEIKFALQAKSIADTGRDINGRFLPLYFQEPGFSVGRDPICIYVMAAVLRVLPLSEMSIRLSTAIVGAIGVGLVFLLACRLFHSRFTPWVVAAVFALAPTYYIHSRLALSVVYPVAFTLLWLILLQAYVASRTRRTALAVGAVLGLGVYSYLASALMMPLYLAATLALLAWQRDWRGMPPAIAAFILLLLPLVAWQAIEPSRYADILSAYRLYDEQPGASSGLLQQLLSPEGLANRVHVYWDSFNPERLFFTGESSLQISTREVGSLLTPVAVLVGAGLLTLLRAPSRGIEWVFVFGLASAPLAGVLMADTEIRRWLVLLPFAAIVSGYGADRWLVASRRGRAAVAALVVLMAIQFAVFTGDYFGPYRQRSSIWFGGNIRAALDSVLDGAEAQAPSMVYLASDIPWVDAYWQFYSKMRGQDLLDRTQYVRLASGEVPQAAPGAVMVTPLLEPALAERLHAAGWGEFRTIPDIDGRPSLMVGSAAVP